MSYGSYSVSDRHRDLKAGYRKGHARRRMRERLPELYLGNEADRLQAEIVQERLDLIDICEEISNGDVVRTLPHDILDEKVDRLLEIGVNFGSDVQVYFYERRVSDLSNLIQADTIMSLELCKQFTKTCLPWHAEPSDPASADASDDDRAFNTKQTTVRQLDGGPQYHRRTSEETLVTASIVKLISLVDTTEDAIILQSLNNLSQAVCEAFSSNMEEEDTKLAKRILTCIRSAIHVIDIRDLDNVSFYDKMFDLKVDANLAKSIAAQKCLQARPALAPR